MLLGCIVEQKIESYLLTRFRAVANSQTWKASLKCSVRQERRNPPALVSWFHFRGN